MSNRRATIRFDPEQIEAAENAVETGEYQNISDFIREAVGEKAEREGWDEVGEKRIRSATPPSE